MFKRYSILILFLFPLLFLYTNNVFPQNTSTSITGKVNDSNDRPITDVKVIANHIPTGSLYGAFTNYKGEFAIPNLQIGGPYKISFTHENFKPFTQSNVFLILGKNDYFNIHLDYVRTKQGQPSYIDHPYVVILSIDGCRWDYPLIYDMPNLAKMADEGVRAEGIIPSYPTKTFPNHFSMATGLYPDHHGIVQNNFYDPDLGVRFTMGNRKVVEDSLFWGGEAIWETAEKQGVKSASFYWVGTETNEYFKPSIRKYFDDQVPFSTRIDSMLSWLYLAPAIRPHLILFYYEEPDGVGHSFGPKSPETSAMLHQIDSLIGFVREGICKAEKDLGIGVNFIVTSDHGMIYIPEGQYTFLADYLNVDEDLTGVAGGNPVWMIQPAKGKKEEIIQTLSMVPNIKVWDRTQLPPHYHYGDNKRIYDVIVEADAGWGLEVERRDIMYSLGTHGYDPQNRDMHAIFYAEGPAFKSGYSQPSFVNVDVYSLLAHILKIKPAQTDGSLEPVRGMLKGY